MLMFGSVYNLLKFFVNRGKSKDNKKLKDYDINGIIIFFREI